MVYFIMDLIVQYLLQFGEAGKDDLKRLLNDKFSDVLDDVQKDNKLRTLLAAMKKNGAIERTSENKVIGKWRLRKK